VNIVHVLSGLVVGGKERVALSLAEHAVRDGHNVSLVLYDTPFRSVAVDFDSREIPVIHLKRGPGLDLLFALRLGRHFRKCQVDAVHAHNATALFYAILAAAWATPNNPRVVATFHAWPTYGRRITRWLTRWAGLFAKATAVSDDLARRLVDAKWLFRCGVVWNGVDTDFYTPVGPTDGWRDRLHVSRGDFLIGHVGRFDPVKRHVDLLEVAARLHCVRPDVVFVLVGQGPLLEAMQNHAAHLPNIRFVRQVTDMPPLLRSLDGLVLCSAHEAAPLSLLEGMACGLPVVATAVGGIPHILRGDLGGEEAGLLVHPGDPDSLLKAILSVVVCSATRQRLSTAARRRALDFRLDTQWMAFKQLYGR